MESVWVDFIPSLIVVLARIQRRRKYCSTLQNAAWVVYVILQGQGKLELQFNIAYLVPSLK